MPDLYIIAGPNGAGKSTLAESLLLKGLNCKEFVNADTIAKGLSGFNYEVVQFKAGRIMLKRINELKDQKTDFAFETTLSSKTILKFINECKRENYKINLFYIFLKNEEIAIKRVKKRNFEGGHIIPDEVVKRRFKRSVKNLFEIYIPVSDRVNIFDNSNKGIIKIAEKEINKELKIYNETIFRQNKSYSVKENLEVYGKDKLLELCQKAIDEELLRKKKLSYSAIIMIDDQILEISGDELTMSVDEIRKKRGLGKKSQDG